MSCSLLSQEDWLEYPNGASMLNKVLLAAIALLGAILFGFEIWLEGQIKQCSPSSTLTGLLRALQIVSILMVVAPVILLIIDYTTINKVSKYSLALPGAALFAALSIALVAIIGSINVQINNLGSSCVEFPNWVWIPVGALAGASVILFIYRYRSRSDVNIPKRVVNWANPVQAEALITLIGEKQGKSCGVNIDADTATQAFAYHYVQKQNEAQGKRGFFGRTFGRKLLIELPKDKIPNIVKMVAEMKGTEAFAVVRQAPVQRQTQSNNSSGMSQFAGPTWDNVQTAGSVVKAAFNEPLFRSQFAKEPGSIDDSISSTGE